MESKTMLCTESVISIWYEVAEMEDAQSRKVDDYAVWKDYRERFDSFPS